MDSTLGFPMTKLTGLGLIGMVVNTTRVDRYGSEFVVDRCGELNRCKLDRYESSLAGVVMNLTGTIP